MEGEEDWACKSQAQGSMGCASGAATAASICHGKGLSDVECEGFCHRCMRHNPCQLETLCFPYNYYC